MTTNKEFFETLVWSLAFFGILTGLLVLSNFYTSVFETGFKPIFVVIALIPFLIFLIATDQLRGISGAGIKVMFRESAQLDVSEGITDEKVLEWSEERELIGVKGGSEPAEGLTTLQYYIGDPSYRDWSDEAYFNNLKLHPELRYILFTKPDGEFQGYMHVGDYKKLLEYDVDTFTSGVETGDILDRESVNTNYIQFNQTNQEALELMDKRKVSELAVVEADGRFRSVVNQDDIIRKYLATAVQSD